MGSLSAGSRGLVCATPPPRVSSPHFTLVSPRLAWAAAAPQSLALAAAAAAAAEDNNDDEDDDDDGEDALYLWMNEWMNGPQLESCAMNALALNSGIMMDMFYYFLWFLPSVWAVEGKPAFNSCCSVCVCVCVELPQ